MSFKGLYVNHKSQKCGVYEFGKDFGNLLCNSLEFPFTYCECDSLDEFRQHYERVKPTMIVFNYHPSTMAWANVKGKYAVPLKYRFSGVHVGTIHEVYQDAADNANQSMFDFHFAADPTLLLKNRIVYKTGRLLPKIPQHVNSMNSSKPIIGSFGFATWGKGFDKIVSLVQSEFDEAVIRFNIPFAHFGDRDGTNAREVVNKCQSILTKPGISLEIDHQYLSKDDLIKFLSGNTINVFLYDDMPNRGISSATDWALASGRPLAVSRSRLFRHLLELNPSVCVEDRSLRSIISDNGASLKKLYEDYSPEVVLWELENNVRNIVNSEEYAEALGRSTFKYIADKALRKVAKSVGYKMPPRNKRGSFNVWTKLEAKDQLPSSQRSRATFEPVEHVNGRSLNSILDNVARKQYAPVVEFFKKHFPDLIAKKIPEANVQQAFVFNTALKLSQGFNNCRILAVGSFEDTAVEALKLLGLDVTPIDPIVNYDLGTFKRKPNVRPESFDLVVSTSVIEHVENDEQFLRDIEFLLKPDGCAILTCDYSDQYVPGDDKPEVDVRLYTQKDIVERLLKATPSLKVIDDPDWDCDQPDFVLANRYRYTFASIVLRKL